MNEEVIFDSFLGIENIVVSDVVRTCTEEILYIGIET